ncbi:MAG: ZIP family metal transporter [Flavobacteriales bacterium Tduv]
MLSTYVRHPDLLLTFSSAYLLGTVFNHLFPEVYCESVAQYKGFFILGGIFIQILLENITHGIEHGHLYHNKKRSFPYGMLIGLCIHSILEGSSILSTDYTLLWAVVIHKIPVAMILYIFLSKTLQKRKNIIGLMSIFALSSPLGFLLSNLPFFTQHHDSIMALVSGVFIHIATVILFESSEEHRLNWIKVFTFFLGVVLSYVLLP